MEMNNISIKLVELVAKEARENEKIIEHKLKEIDSIVNGLKMGTVFVIMGIAFAASANEMPVKFRQYIAQMFLEMFPEKEKGKE